MGVLDPRRGVGELHAGLADEIEDTEVMPKQKSVWDVQVGLAGDSGKIIVPAGVLREESTYKVWFEYQSFLVSAKFALI